MDALTRIGWIGFITLVLAVSGCGGGGGGGGTSQSGTVVGAAGGTVAGPNGAKVVIPAGALATDTTILIEQTSAGSPPLPGGFSVSGQMFAFTPHGTTFAVPVTLTLPFDPASVPAGSTPTLLKTNAQNRFEQVAGATFGADSVTAQVTSFSFAQIVFTGLVSTDPVRAWAFSELIGDNLVTVTVPPPDGNGVQRAGPLEKIVNFGPAFFDSEFVLLDGTTLPPDEIAVGYVSSTADGKTFALSAEAQRGNPNIPGSTIGSISELSQHQTFIKREADASLKITLAPALIEVHDHNLVLGRACPAAHAQGELCDVIKGEIYLDLWAHTEDLPPSSSSPTPITFFYTGGRASLNGFAGSWDSKASNHGRTPLWTIEDFDFVIEDFVGVPQGHVSMKLRNPLTFTVDLSSIDVGKAFTLEVFTFATAYNRIAGPPSEFETSAGAYLMDPRTGGGTTMITTGLEPTNTPLLGFPPGVLVPPAACVPGPGPNPAAGVLQFSAASYTQLESNTTPTITVTRTGGSKGAVTATFSTSDGTAIGGTDYTPVSTTIFFADGDTAQRVVEVPIIQDLISGEPDKTVNLTLSQPGGCAALGAQTTAVLTIRDDDAPPPPPRFTVGGTVNGLIGTVVLEDHHGLFLEITGDGPFTFTNLPTLGGLPYSVRVFNQPFAPVQVCTVSNGSGVFGNANVTNVVVNCV